MASGHLVGSTIPFEPQVRSASFGYLEKTISQFVVSMGAVVARKNEKNKRGNSLIGKWKAEKFANR